MTATIFNVIKKISYDKSLSYRIFGFLLLSILTLLEFPMVASAQPTTCGAFLILVTKIGNMLQAFVGAVAIIMILVAAFKYITAGDDAQKVKSAHLTITYAVVGIAVGILAFFSVEIIESIIGGTLPASC